MDRTLTPGAERLVGEEGPTPASAGRRILHVDLDAFYASVETRERPELVGLPVIVGADPKEGRGRGVVTTASYEARRFGVRSAMPISQAWRLCPQGVFVPPRFDLYHDVSERLFGILRATGAVVEAASIDEAYLDASTLAADFVEARALARRIQDAVLDAERVSASVGVASNKLVAKIATDMRKPAGVTVVPAGKEVAFLGPLPVRKIPGVGPKTEGQLRDMHVTTCGDLARTPAGVLASR
ncbi:MAG TPA: DNA polymerase IV, partial [Candidatus Thermoplasmatota archaeon]|nr:DNA polymerase IV [Candidatus Thermoplasmatota archaeon]